MIVIRGAVELHRDAQAVSGPAHAADKYRADVKFTANLTDIDGLRFEAERRSPPYDLQTGDLSQCVNQFLGEAVAEELVFIVVAEVDEWYHRDGKVACWRDLHRRRTDEVAGKVKTNARDKQNHERDSHEPPASSRLRNGGKDCFRGLDLRRGIGRVRNTRHDPAECRHIRPFM